MTGKNYDGIIFPMYEKYRMSILFFGAYLFVNYLLLYNLILAVFCTSYASNLHNKTKLI